LGGFRIKEFHAKDAEETQSTQRGIEGDEKIPIKETGFSVEKEFHAEDAE
jgi:hypothetical protein